jgi:hypothetical protein
MKAQLFLVLTLLMALSASQTKFRPPKDSNQFIVQLDPYTVIYNDPVSLEKKLEERGYLDGVGPKDNEKWKEVVGSANNNSCINGKDQTKLTPQQQLEEFINGPCSPFIIVPGLFSSKLTVSIDCQVLQTENPEIFSTCGWTSCSNSPLSKSPEPEYMVWVSSFTSPMSLGLPTTSNCWGELMKLTYLQEEQAWNKKFTSPVGVNVSVYGADPNTEADAQCGFSAICDLLD